MQSQDIINAITTTGDDQLSNGMNITRLPYEIIIQILSYLPVYTLPKIASTCRNLYAIVHDDSHWKTRVHSLNLHYPLKSPWPFASWQALFLAHYPFWFLPQRTLWFADGIDLDGGLAGQLLLARYDHRTGNIDGYQLIGEKGGIHTHPWPERPNVSIHDFHPSIRLHLAHPVIRLRPRPGTSFSDAPGTHGTFKPDLTSGTRKELPGLASERPAQTTVHAAHRIDVHVMLARAIAPARIHPSMRLWPPARLPALARVRRMSPSLWNQVALSRPEARGTLDGTSFDRPTHHADVCDAAFRLRRSWGRQAAALFELVSAGTLNLGVRAGDHEDGGGLHSGALAGVGVVATYSTLPEEAYRPSKTRPYQGLWVGDYAGHGCEFLLIRQRVGWREKREAEPVKPKLDSLFAETNPIVLNQADANADTGMNMDAVGVTNVNTRDEGDEIEESMDDDDEEDLGNEEREDDTDEQRRHGVNNAIAREGVTTGAAAVHRRRYTSNGEGSSRSTPMEEQEPVGETGCLEAIKLTGDANVPRGEFTFVAEEIGRAGQLYIAETAEFEGKRVVGSWGHIAARGFQDDVFIKADLILVSHDCLAQYWHEFSHVAFYRRVDIDKFLNPDDGDGRLQL